MQFRLSTLFAIVAVSAFAIAVVALVLPGPRSVLMGYELSRQRAYEQIETGNPIEYAIKLLGEPRSRESYFSRELTGYENEIPIADLEKCVEFLTWNNGGNWFYCVGVDKNGIIVLKADGHS